MKNFLVQRPHLEFVLTATWFEAEDRNLALHFRELEADELLAAERYWRLFAIEDYRIGLSHGRSSALRIGRHRL